MAGITRPVVILKKFYPENSSAPSIVHVTSSSSGGLAFLQNLEIIDRVIEAGRGFARNKKGESMKNTSALFFLLVLVATLFIAGCTQQQAAPPVSQPAAGPAQVTTAAGASDNVRLMDTKFGSVLADAKGMTLYYFVTDIPASGTSTCYAEANCSRFWPVFSVDKTLVSPPLAATDFSPMTRTDGAKQSVYRGWPLYYFANDKAPGDVRGEDVQKLWYVAKPDYTVMLAKQPSTGTFLTDGTGRTLYFFAKDAPGAASCTGTCLDKWPPFTSGTIVVPSVLKPADFSAIARSDGVKQTAFMGRMLYYFSGDSKPGEINGHGFNNLWYVANITGYTPPVPAPTTVPTTMPTIDYGSSSDSGGGGGY
jgi:predicted lipoprotein with Yx(FWY)xxD motif